MPVVTAVLVVVFGGLTFWLDDPRFIKMKPTIINLLFAGVLFGRPALRRPLLKLLLGEAFNLTDEGWRKLTRALGDLLPGPGRPQRDRLAQLLGGAWVNFKVFGILPLTLVFAVPRSASSSATRQAKRPRPNVSHLRDRRRLILSKC